MLFHSQTINGRIEKFTQLKGVEYIKFTVENHNKEIFCLVKKRRSKNWGILSWNQFLQKGPTEVFLEIDDDPVKLSERIVIIKNLQDQTNIGFMSRPKLTQPVFEITHERD